MSLSVGDHRLALGRSDTRAAVQERLHSVGPHLAVIDQTNVGDLKCPTGFAGPVATDLAVALNAELPIAQPLRRDQLPVGAEALCDLLATCVRRQAVDLGLVYTRDASAPGGRLCR